MTKRVFLLNGIAILAVVCNHTTSWGITAMFWWTDRYRPVTVPNFDQIGTLPYYVLVLVRKIAVFSVPAFIFVAGFFVAYAARGRQSGPTWRTVRSRVVNLLTPYMVWSVAIFVTDALQGTTYSPIEYLVRLGYLGASGGYYFVPLLCQLYLLSPLVVPVARTHWRWLLFVSALLQLSIISQLYVGYFFGDQAPVLKVMTLVAPGWLFFKHAFDFSLGIVVGLHLQKLKGWLDQHKWKLLAAAAALGTLAILESEAVFRSIKQDWMNSSLTIWSSLYAVACILGFLAYHDVRLPFSEALNRLAKRTFGIYLLHDQGMELIARAIRQFAPWILAHPLLFQPLVFIFGLGMPLILMKAIAQSPLRKAYPYLFG